MRPLVLLLLALVPSVTQAQVDSGTVRITYELVAGNRVSGSYDQLRSAGSFPLVAPPRTVQPGRRVATPLRLIGCFRNNRRGLYNVDFDATLGVDGQLIGAAGVLLSLSNPSTPLAVRHYSVANSYSHEKRSS